MDQLLRKIASPVDRESSRTTHCHITTIFLHPSRQDDLVLNCRLYDQLLPTVRPNSDGLTLRKVKVGGIRINNKKWLNKFGFLAHIMPLMGHKRMRKWREMNLDCMSSSNGVHQLVPFLVRLYAE